jgi:signal transduction histidine kinase
MLKGPLSLASRAGLIFISIYVVVLVAVLAMLALSNAFSEPGDNPYGGARMAMSFAGEELREADGEELVLSSDGKFAQLAARNPSMWLLARQGDRSLSFGPVPPAALDLMDRRRGAFDSARFLVPGLPAGIANATIARWGEGSDALLLAVGGVDPATMSAGDWLHGFHPEPVLVALVFIAVLGLVAMGVALPLFARAIRPITAEAGSVVPQDPDRRLDERKAPRELLPLVRAFNATLDRLGAELARRKRFITDVAHELRTPLAVVSLRVEALEEEGAKQDLRRGVGRLTHLVSQMLDLERLSLSDRRRRRLDLVAIARDVLADLAPMAIKAGYDVSLDAPETAVTVTGDEHAIARALTNLIGNSVAHGGGAGQIRVAVRAEGTIDVIDEGPGIPPSLLPNLFEPFSRGNPNGEGCGLGLHLTREIMRAYGGEVSLMPGARGATFRLSFAAAQDEG